MPLLIQTERLTLSPFQASDAEDMFAWASDPELTLMMGWPTHKSVGDSRKIIDLFKKSEESQPPHFDRPLAIRDKGTGRAMGSTGLHTNKKFGENVIEPGWILKREAQGQGYAFEAAQALVNYAFRELAWMPFMISTVNPNNPRSRAVMLKLGMYEWQSQHSIQPQIGPEPNEVLIYRRDRETR